MRLKNFFEKHGCSVVSLVRTAKETKGTILPFSLRDKIESGNLQNVDVLIHCAYDFSATRWDEIVKVNVEGARHLFEAARSAGVKTIIFISTMSAFSGCRTFYGQAKLLIEDEAKKVGAFIIRPGLVYDSQAGGMMGALCSAIEGLPCIPLIGNGKQQLYLLHSEDLCHFVLGVARGQIPAPFGPVTLAHEQGFTFQDILKIIAKNRGKTPLLIPVPAGCLYAILRTAEALGLRSRIRSDSVRSLVFCDPSPRFAEMRRLGFVPRMFSAETLLEVGG